MVKVAVGILVGLVVGMALMLPLSAARASDDGGLAFIISAEKLRKLIQEPFIQARQDIRDPQIRAFYDKLLQDLEFIPPPAREGS